MFLRSLDFTTATLSPPSSFGSTVTTRVLGYFLERPFRWPPFGSKHIFLTQVSPCSKASCGMMSAVMTRPACRGGGAASRDLSELVARQQRRNNTRESPPTTTTDPHPPQSRPSTFHSWMLTVLYGKSVWGRLGKGSFPDVWRCQGAGTDAKYRVE